MEARRNRSARVLCVMTAVALILGACDEGGGNGEDATQDAPAGGGSGEGLLIGHASPYSGQEAYLGPAMLEGIELAEMQINEAGGVLGDDVRYQTADTEGRPDAAVPAISELLDVENVDALIGPTSLTIFSVIDRILESGTPDLVIGSTSELDTAMGGEKMWRLIPSDSLMGPAMAKVALDDGFDQAVALFEDQESAQSVKAGVIPAYEELGGEIVTEVDPAIGQSNYRAEVQSLLSADADLIFMQLSPEVGSTFWRNALEFGADLEGKTIISTDVALTEDTIKSLGPVIDMIDMRAVSPAAEGPAYPDFVEAYREFHDKQTPEVFSAHTWDAMTLFSLAATAAESTERADIAAQVREVGEEPGTECMSFEECRDLLEDGEEIDYEGASSSIEWDDNGNIIAGFGIFRYEDGEMKQVATLTEPEVREIAEQLLGS
jgi:ABC-type branched-subunit amino acid transport system substrate-binding protein